MSLTATAAKLKQALDRALERRTGAIGISLAASPLVRAALEGRVLNEHPVVRGRTIWPNGGDGVMVVESPNHYGIGERIDSAAGAFLLITRPGAPWTGRKPEISLAPDGRTFEPATEDGESPGSLYRVCTDAARRLAKRVTQVGRVHPVAKVESPVFVVLVPGPPGPVADGVGSNAAVSCEAIVAPGLPGAVRFEVGWLPAPGELDAVAASFAAAVGATKGNSRS
jgi:hypothetical protein